MFCINPKLYIFLKLSNIIKDSWSDLIIERLDVSSYVEILDKILSDIPEIQCAVISSLKGDPLAAKLPQRIDDYKMAGMTTALLILGKLNNAIMENGDFEFLRIKILNDVVLCTELDADIYIFIYATEDISNKLVSLLKEIRTKE